VRKVRPVLAVVLVAVVLFAATGIVALLTELSQRLGEAGQSTTNNGLFLILVALGITVVSVGVVAGSRWKRRRPKRRYEKSSKHNARVTQEIEGQREQPNLRHGDRKV